MDIEFANRKLQETCNAARSMNREWGPQMAKKVQQRLAELAAAIVLEDMRKMPGRCHELKADRKGQLALDLVHPKRLVFSPGNNPKPVRPDGGLDWSKVTRIVILEVVDYHD
ncbi:MAG: killer suppression protein [Planctomycetes bacterium]|jgi:plasmid maintenance system killer protein|nr:killer suppression protein [Planctomycetota bacterium]